jgi:hypothetical protein
MSVKVANRLGIMRQMDKKDYARTKIETSMNQDIPRFHIRLAIFANICACVSL